jgi:hypothetical protein
LVKARYLTRTRSAPAPSVDDLMEKELTELAVQEAIKMIKPWVDANRARLLKSLTHAELTALAEAMIGTWIARRSEMEAAEAKLNDSIDDLWRA